MPVTHAKSDTIADWSGVVTINNSTGGTTTDQASNLVRPIDWNSNHVVSLSASEVAPVFQFGSGLSSSTAAGGISVGIQSDPWFVPFPLFNTASTQMSLSSMSNGTWYFDGPYENDQALAKGQIHALFAFPANFAGGAAYSAASTGSVTRTITQYNHWAIYTQASGANTTRLESYWTAQNSWIATNEMRLSTANTSSGSFTNYLTLSFPGQWDSNGGVTYTSTATSGTSNLSASTMASTRYDSLISGVGAYLSGSIMAIFGMSTTLPPTIFWVGRMTFSTSASAGTSGGIAALGTNFGVGSVLGQVDGLVNAYKRQGLSVSNSTTNVRPFHGFLATSTTQATASLGTADIRGTTGQMYWHNWLSTY
jgi:hypothetical protein